MGSMRRKKKPQRSDAPAQRYGSTSPHLKRHIPKQDTTFFPQPEVWTGKVAKARWMKRDRAS